MKALDVADVIDRLEVVLYDQQYVGDYVKVVRDSFGVVGGDIYVEVTQSGTHADVVLTASQARIAAKALKRAAKQIEGKL